MEWGMCYLFTATTSIRKIYVDAYTIVQSMWTVSTLLSLLVFRYKSAVLMVLLLRERVFLTNIMDRESYQKSGENLDGLISS